MQGCYRLVKPIDIAPVLSIVDRLQFVSVNQGGAKYKCDVVLRDQLPKELKDLIASLELGGTQARAILRRLAPFQSIPPHVDDWMPQEADWHRFQVPLTSHPSILMRWPDDGVEAHLAPGFLYEVNFQRKHEVVHPADCYRIHLQIDQVDATI
jgi:hypothetical protein